MRLPELITREIQDLDKIRLSAIELSMQFPKDNILRLNVEQTESRKQLLINELDESLKFYQHKRTLKSMPLTTTYQYLTFEEQYVNRKTRVFFVKNHSTGVYIGEIAWAGNWRKYVFFTANGVMFDSGCLDDISDFLKKLMSDWREKKQKAKQSP